MPRIDGCDIHAGPIQPRTTKKITTIEHPKWTELYHHTDPNKKAFGAKVTITLNDGTQIIDEIERANAHPGGAKPFQRDNYIRKFKTLTDGIITPPESKRFLDLVQRLPELSAAEIQQLNIVVNQDWLLASKVNERGIF